MILPTNAPSIWPRLRYHPVHAQLWKHSGRFAAIVAGRQSGKTELCRRKIVLQLPLIKEWPDPLYFYILPTHQQARMTVWYKFLQLIPKEWIPRNGANKSEMCISTIFGSKLYIVGADKPHRLEGNSADFVMIDESSDQRPGLYSKTIMPMLGMREGRCYRLGVPKKSGIGRIEFRDFFKKGLNLEDNITSFHWKSEEVWTPEEIEVAKSQVTPEEYEEQYNATWMDQGGTVYYNFTPANIRDDIYYDPSCEILVGCDFNVDPMCWVLGHYKDSKLYIFDEIFLRNTNTQAALDYINNKYYQHTAGWRFYGDATSRNKHTSALRTDFLTIKNDARFGQKKVVFPNRNPHVRDRVACVNRAFKTADGVIRAYVSSSCKRLINDLNMVSYIEGTSEIEDYHGTDIGHMVDAYGYIVHTIMPMQVELKVVPAIWSVG